MKFLKQYEHIIETYLNKSIIKTCHIYPCVPLILTIYCHIMFLSPLQKICKKANYFETILKVNGKNENF